MVEKQTIYGLLKLIPRGGSGQLTQDNKLGQKIKKKKLKKGIEKKPIALSMFSQEWVQPGLMKNPLDAPMSTKWPNFYINSKKA